IAVRPIHRARQNLARPSSLENHVSLRAFFFLRRDKHKAPVRKLSLRKRPRVSPAPNEFRDQPSILLTQFEPRRIFAIASFYRQIPSPEKRFGRFKLRPKRRNRTGTGNWRL